MSILSAVLGGSGGSGGLGELCDSPWATTALVAAAIGCFMLTLQRWRQKADDVADEQLPTGVSLRRQAVPIDGEPDAYRSALLPASSNPCIDTVVPEVTTLYQLFLRGLEVRVQL